MEGDFLVQQSKLLLLALLSYVIFNAMDGSYHTLLPAALADLQPRTLLSMVASSKAVPARRMLLSVAQQQAVEPAGQLQQLPLQAPALSYSWAYRNPNAGAAHGSQSHNDTLPYTHMGMLEVLPDGRIAAAWQGSTQGWEGGTKQALYMATSTDDGASWSQPCMVVPPADGSLPVWGPVLHVQNGTVWLFYAASKQQCGGWGETGQGFSPGGDILAVRSNDNGTSWSKPTVVWSFREEGGIPKVVANKLAVADNGAWVLPFWHEAASEACGSNLPVNKAAGVLISNDKGGNWSMAPVAALHSTWLIEATITPVTSPTEPPALLQMFRTALGAIFQSWSVDDGRTWSTPIPSDLPNPNSKVNVLRLPSGVLLLAYNNDTTTGVRTPLTLAASRDGGETWHAAAVIEDDPAGSFSYPTIQYVPQSKRILVIYSVNYQESVGRLAAWGWTCYGMKVASLDATPFLAVTNAL